MTSEKRLSLRLRYRGSAIVAALDSHPIAGQLRTGTLPRSAYVLLLTQIVHQVRGSAPMLKSAGERLAKERPDIARLLQQKSREEDGHDRWALDDLEVLGVPRDMVETAEPSAAVNLYQAWVRFCLDQNPIGILGLAYALEWLGKERAGLVADSLVANGGIPNVASAVTFLRGHADADIEHIAVLERAVNEITDDEDAAFVEFSAELTGVAYLGFFERTGSNLSRTAPSPHLRGMSIPDARS